MKILIVDDEKLIVEYLKIQVEKLYPKAMIYATVSALDALKQAQTEEFDVAILDIDMPNMNGLDLARKLIAGYPAINIFFSTGYAEYSLEAHELYCSAFLTKPIDMDKLKKAFENLRKPVLPPIPDWAKTGFSGGALIGKKLEFYRSKAEISRQELADLMNVTRQTIYRWEQGDRMPDILTFMRLTRLLGVSMEDILINEED